MARPTKPKDLKPKSAEDADGGEASAKPGGAGLAIDIKFLVTILAIFLCSSIASVASVYFIAPMVIVPAIVEKLPKPGAEAGAEGEGEGEGEGHPASKTGMNVQLDEFTVNLKADPNEGGNQFLRAKMSLSVTPPSGKECGGHAQLPVKAQPVLASVGPGVIVGGAAATDEVLLANGGGEGGGDPCVAEFTKHMSAYIPAIRDIINSSLMKRTAEQLSTLEGQEALKDEIKDQINQLMTEGYQVIRVNFEDFIIQR